MEAQRHGALTFCGNRAFVETVAVFSTLSAAHKALLPPKEVLL